MKNEILSERTKRLLVIQGFSEQDVDGNPNILPLTKWTPLLCAIFGIIGLILGSAYYFLILGLLMFVGAFSPYSIYDYLYKHVFRYIFRFGNGVPHGIQRKIGSGIGAVAYMASGLGFYFDIVLLAYIPACFMITFALIAGFFNWCFVSSFYVLDRGKTENKCC